MRIAVIGGGHGCYAAAADLAEQGHEVRLWRRDGAALAPVKARGGLVLKDFKGTREVPLALVTDEVGAAVANADVVLSPLPATAQAEVAKALAPHLTGGQIVFIPPGSFGSLVMARVLRNAGNRAAVVYAESGTLPYLTRRHGPDTIAITTRATRLPTGVFPANASDEALDKLRQVYPAIEPLRDALDAATMNAGPIIHPPLIVMNAGPLQHFERWDIHNEGTQPAIRAVTDRLDAERIAIREELGYGAPHFPLADHYDPSRPEWMYGNVAHEKLTDSGDWREHIDLHHHRYMREDVSQGLALLVSLADWAGVPAPTAAGLLALGSAIVGEDLRQTGRTWERLGLADLARSDLRRLLDAGLPGRR
jgi:opine dehydrogenase